MHEIHQKILDEFDSYHRKNQKPSKKNGLQQFRPPKHPTYREKLRNNLSFSGEKHPKNQTVKLQKQTKIEDKLSKSGYMVFL